MTWPFIIKTVLSRLISIRPNLYSLFAFFLFCSLCSSFDRWAAVVCIECVVMVEAFWHRRSCWTHRKWKENMSCKMDAHIVMHIWGIREMSYSTRACIANMNACMHAIRVKVVAWYMIHAGMWRQGSLWMRIHIHTCEYNNLTTATNRCNIRWGYFRQYVLCVVLRGGSCGGENTRCFSMIHTRANV